VLEKTTACTMDSQKDQRVSVGRSGRWHIIRGEAVKLKLSYFGHVIRADELEKDFIHGMGNGTGSKGRPEHRWLNEIREATTLISGS